MYKGILQGSMPCMLQLENILQNVKGRLNDGTLFQQRLLVDLHKLVFHALLDACDKLEPSLIENLKQLLADVSLIAKEQAC